MTSTCDRPLDPPATTDLDDAMATALNEWPALRSAFDRAERLWNSGDDCRSAAAKAAELAEGISAALRRAAACRQGY